MSTAKYILASGVVLSLFLSSPAKASLGPCYLDANTLKVTGMSIQTAQAMHDNPSAYTNIPWCDSLQGVYLGNLDLNGNGIIDALEPAPPPTSTPVPTPAPATATPSPSQPSVGPTPSTVKQSATPRQTDGPQVQAASIQATASPATPVLAPKTKSQGIKLASKSESNPIPVLVGLLAVVLLGLSIARRLIKNRK